MSYSVGYHHHSDLDLVDMENMAKAAREVLRQTFADNRPRYNTGNLLLGLAVWGLGVVAAGSLVRRVFQ
jgi:hypothetical protein